MKKPLIFIAKATAFGACITFMVVLLCVLPDAARAADACAEAIAPDWVLPAFAAVMLCNVMLILHGEIRNRLHWRRQRVALAASIEGIQP